jgi:hypothetical protein
LSILLSILSLLCAKRAVDEGKYRLWAAFGMSGLLGARTLPHNAFLVVSLSVWAALVGDVNVRRKAVRYHIGIAPHNPFTTSGD